MKMMGVLVVPFRGLNLWIGTASVVVELVPPRGGMNLHTPIKQDSGTF